MKVEDKQEIIIIQWQTCVEMANSVSLRRDNMNNLFVTLNLAIIATVSFALDIKSILILIAGIAICLLWLSFIKYYRLLNKAKFTVIKQIEKHLPIAPFGDEWNKLLATKGYRDGTQLERFLPFTFVCLYMVAIVVIIKNKY